MTQNCDRASQAIELLGQQKLELSDRDREEIIERIRGASHICKNTSSGSFLLPSSSFLLAPDS
jgi:hypothetical protein